MSKDVKYWNQITQNGLSKLSQEQKKRCFELFAKSRQKNTTNKESLEFLLLKNTMNVYDTTSTNDVFAKINKGINNPVTYDLMIQNLYKIKFNLTDEIPKLKLPVTIITGKQDPLNFLTQEFKNLYPKAKIIWIDKCGHFPMFEQPAVFYQNLSDA